MNLMRTCPKCGDIWAAECDFCCSCGAPMVARSVMPKKPKTKPRRARSYRLCIYCGGRSAGIACASHRDLLAIDPGWTR